MCVRVWGPEKEGGKSHSESYQVAGTNSRCSIVVNRDCSDLVELPTISNMETE